MKRLSLLIVVILALLALSIGLARAQDDSRTFPETGKTVSGLFLRYWDAHGALAQQGYPISDPMQEVNDTDSKTYTVQYFERAVFEAHPENQPPYDVELSLLGAEAYEAKYPSGAPNQHADPSADIITFPETGKTLGGKFKQYWEAHGGLDQQGYPISDEFTETSTLDGKQYTVQYFQRAVFEDHPENQPPFDVLLSLLGNERFSANYANGALGGPTPTETPTPKPVVQPTATPTEIVPPASGGIPYENPLGSETSHLKGFNFDVKDGETIKHLIHPDLLAKTWLKTLDRQHNTDQGANYKDFIDKYLQSSGKVTITSFRPTGQFYTHSGVRTSLIEVVPNVQIDLDQEIDIVSDLPVGDPSAVIMDGRAMSMEVSQTGKVKIRLQNNHNWNGENISSILRRFWGTLGQINEAPMPDNPDIPFTSHIVSQFIHRTCFLTPADVAGITD